MQKLTTKKLIATAFLAGVLGLSSVPLGASANSYHNDGWSWRSRDDNDRRRCVVLDRDDRDSVHRIFLERRFERVNDRWHNNNREDDVNFFGRCHVVFRDDDGRIMRTYYQW